MFILGSIKGVFFVLLIILLFAGWLIQTVNKLQKGVERNRRIRRKDKLNSSPTPLENESAEDFFARMALEQQTSNAAEPKSKKPPRLKLNPDNYPEAPAATYSSLSEDTYGAEDYIPGKRTEERLSDEEFFKKLGESNDDVLNDVKSVTSVSQKRKSRKSKNRVNRKNLKSFKHGIIMNEVLNRPKAYEL